jgi:hypothetical protein
MSIARYEPWNVVSHLQGEINRIFSHTSAANNGASSRATADWQPDRCEQPCALFRNL